MSFKIKPCSHINHVSCILEVVCTCGHSRRLLYYSKAQAEKDGVILSQTKCYECSTKKAELEK